MAEGSSHDFLLRGRGSFVNSRESSFVENHDAVATAQQFRQFGTYKEDALSGRRELVDDAVDLLLCRDVDSPRRIVEEKNIQAQQEPAGKQCLLLVAAAQAANCVKRACALQSKALIQALSCVDFLLALEESP